MVPAVVTAAAAASDATRYTRRRKRSTGTPSALRGGIAAQQHVQLRRDRHDRDEHDSERDQRGPRRRRAVEIARQPEDHAAQPVLGRDR